MNDQQEFSKILRDMANDIARTGEGNFQTEAERRSLLGYLYATVAQGTIAANIKQMSIEHEQRTM